MTAPFGERCGAYLRTVGDGSDRLFYKHCGDTRIKIEVDRVDGGGNYFECFNAWEHKHVAYRRIADDAWYVGLC